MFLSNVIINYIVFYMNRSIVAGFFMYYFVYSKDYYNFNSNEK